MTESDSPNSEASLAGAETSSGPDAAPAIQAADALPPVEPPNPGMILKLFLVPGIIVFAVVLLVLLITAASELKTDPLEQLAAIERGAANSWQMAESLAHELRSSAELRSNVEFNQRVSAFLQRRLEQDLPSQGNRRELSAELQLRIFLCQCLGECDLAEGLETLMIAGEQEPVEPAREVRLSAIASIALLIDNVRTKNGNQLPPEFAKAAHAYLLERSHEGSGERSLGPVRSRAAFALGVLGGKDAQARLEQMIQIETYPDARYNAATGLARHGNAACLETLEEMIDPRTDNTALEVEEVVAARTFKQWTIQINGIRAAELLAEANKDADMASIVPVVRELRDVSDLPKAIDQQAYQLLLTLEGR